MTPDMDELRAAKRQRAPLPLSPPLALRTNWPLRYLQWPTVRLWEVRPGLMA